MSATVEGRIAVVTGASSGIGEAIARTLAAQGGHVALIARREDRLRALAADLSDHGPGTAIAVAADVTDTASMRAAAAQVLKELGSADILVNAAGQGLLGPFSDDRADETRRLVEVNLLGAMTTTGVFLEQLRAGGRGDLVNISSIGGRNAHANASVYNGTKWGLNGWSEALRQEVLPDVRVIVVGPGAVDTPLIDAIAHEPTRRAFRETYPPGSILHAQDVAEVVAFAVGRPRHVALSEILVRPTSQVY